LLKDAFVGAHVSEQTILGGLEESAAIKK